MRTAAAALLLALCVASTPGLRANTDDLPRPKGRPPVTEDSEELPPYPEHAPPRSAGDEFEDQDHFWLNDNDGKQQWEDPTYVITDEDGHETFRDPATGQPTDVRPAEAAWLSLWDEEYEHEYFFNELTNDSTWTVPYNFAWHKVWVDENGTVVSLHAEEGLADAQLFDDGEFAGDVGEEEGQEGEEMPEWDPSGSYDDEGEGQWEGDGEAYADMEPDLLPSEEELAEEEILRQEAGGEADSEEL